MANQYFQFKQFTIYHDRCAMKVNTDSVLLGSWADITNASAILDVGAGTGLLAIMLAQRSGAYIEAMEVEQSAYMQAAENIQSCPWFDRIFLHHSSFQEFAYITNKKYDLIISNPPYFVSSLKAIKKERTMARHCDTLTHSELLNYSASLLTSNGLLSVIMPYSEGHIFIAEAIKYGFYCSRKTYIKSTSEQSPKRILVEFSKIPVNPAEDTIIVKGGYSKKYTEKYINLTKDFYIKF
jgi:tRNA1Val (adenine37-N6)-methyltransferase